MSHFIYASVDEFSSTSRSWIDDPRPIPQRVPCIVVTTDENGDMVSIASVDVPKDQVERFVKETA